MIGFKQGFESAEFLIELFFFKKYNIQLSSPEVLKCLKLSETYISQYHQIFPSLAHTHTHHVFTFCQLFVYLEHVMKVTNVKSV